MPDTIPLHNWLRYMNQDYLTTFVRQGGTAVKFAVTPDHLRADLVAQLREQSRQNDYLFVRLDAGETRIHMPQDIFFELARQIDWRQLAKSRVLQLAAQKSYRVEGLDASLTGNVYQAIARGNNLDADSILLDLRPALRDSVLRSVEMARDFRTCMLHLCLMEHVVDGAEYTGQQLLDWLTGVNHRISNVRTYSIFTGINRSTARHFIESALHWVREAGHAGTLILLDSARVTLSPNPRDGRRYYTRAAAMEHYELLREFVDGADRLTSTLLVVAATAEFLDDSPQSKGYGVYPALRTRIMDDVRDRELVNPVASLVRLA